MTTAFPIYRTSNPIGRGSVPILPMDQEQARFWRLRRDRQPMKGTNNG